MWVRKAIAEVRYNRTTIVCLLRVDMSAVYFQEKVLGIDQNGTTINLDYNSTCRWIQGRIPFWENGSEVEDSKRPIFQSVVVVLEAKK